MFHKLKIGIVISLCCASLAIFNPSIISTHADVNSLVQLVASHKHGFEYHTVLSLYNQLHQAGYSGKSCLSILAVVGQKTWDYNEYRFYHTNHYDGYFRFNSKISYNYLHYAHHWHLNPNQIANQVNYLDSKGQANNRDYMKHYRNTAYQGTRHFIVRDLHQRVPYQMYNYDLYIEEWLEQPV